MNCRQARIELALCVGDDLPDATRRENLRRHVVQCPGCRAHYKRLRGTLQMLESSDGDRTYDVGGSLWPQLSQRIRRMEETPEPTGRFNGWMPFVAVTAACALLVVVMDLQSPGVPPATNTHGAVARDFWGSSALLPSIPESAEHNAFLPTQLRTRSPQHVYALESADGNRAQPLQVVPEERPLAAENH